MFPSSSFSLINQTGAGSFGAGNLGSFNTITGPASTVGSVGTNIFSGLRKASDNNALLDDALKEIENLTNSLAGLAGAGSRQVQPLTPNFASINSRARKSAAKAVNPFYQKEITEFIRRRNLAKTRAQRDAETGIERAQQNLQDLLELGQTQRERTAEDTARNIDEVNIQEDVFQEQAGREFDAGRRGLQEDIAASGLTTSGLGRGRIREAERARGAEEGEVARQTNVKREAYRRLKTRTFEDIFDREKRGQRDTDLAIKDIKIDLEDFIEDIEADIVAQKRRNERERLQALRSEEDRQRQILLTKFVNAISDPAVRLATAQSVGV